MQVPVRPKIECPLRSLQSLLYDCSEATSNPLPFLKALPCTPVLWHALVYLAYSSSMFHHVRVKFCFPFVCFSLAARCGFRSDNEDTGGHERAGGGRGSETYGGGGIISRGCRTRCFVLRRLYPLTVQDRTAATFCVEREQCMMRTPGRN